MLTKTVGRNHISIQYGYHFATKVFAVSLIIALATLIFLVINNKLPVLALFTLLPLSICFVSLVYLARLGDNIAALLPAMGLVAASANGTPLMLSLTLFY